MAKTILIVMFSNQLIKPIYGSAKKNIGKQDENSFS